MVKVFGSGIAYPLRTNDGMQTPEVGKLNPRADSFSLYMNHVGNTMLQNILPKSKLDHQTHKIVRAGHEQDHVHVQRSGIKQAVQSLSTVVVKNKA